MIAISLFVDKWYKTYQSCTVNKTNKHKNYDFYKR